MDLYAITHLLYFYGIFLITCGIISVIFIGMKAKTALVSGGTAGALSLLTGYLLFLHTKGAQVAGILLSLALVVVFSWRSAKTLFRIFELISIAQYDELKGKGVAFLIISMMAVVSMLVLALQLISY